MTASITIRDIPDATWNELAGRAATSGHSLETYLRAHLIELARRPEPEARMSRIRERKERSDGRLSEEAILRHRDADRR